MIAFAKKILVTCALPYINNVPHLGNLVPILSADIYTRFLRNKGENVIYICATDEHGTRTEIEAAKRKLSPAAYSKKLHKEIYNIFKWFNIEFDNFGRTSCKENHQITQDIFLKLFKKGYIIKKEIIQLYCGRCRNFLPDTYVEGTCPHCNSKNARGDQCDACGQLLNPEDLINPHCKVCGTTPESRSTKHLFLDLPKLEPKIKKWINTKKKAWKGVAISLPLGWLKTGLQERCITRDLKFGVKVPLKGYENKVFYVWFDAPNGYVASTAEWAKKHKKNWKKWWFSKDVHYVQFMGKDNVPFHTLVWPGSLLGTGDNWHLVDYLCSNEYLNYDGGQFSKSQGRGVFTSDAIKLGFDPDLWRFYIASILPEAKDSDFRWLEFLERINKELIANIGNLVYRTLSFTKKSFGRIPKVALGVKEKKLIERVKKLSKKADKELENFEFKQSLKTILAIGNLANQYFQKQEPWVAIKTNKTKCALTLKTCCEIIEILADKLEPFVPNTSKKIKEQLKLKKVEILFRKLDPKEIEKIEKKFAGKSQKFSNKKIIVDKELRAKIKRGDISVAFGEFAGLNVQRRSGKLEKLKRSFKLDEKKLKKVADSYRYLVKEGRDKHDAPLSCENLLQFYKKKQLPNINTLTDAYNLISLKTGLIMGVYDEKGIVGNVVLKVADGSEYFVSIGDKKPTTIQKGEYLVCDSDNKVLTKWVTKQGDYVAVSKSTRKAIICVQGNKHISQKEVDKVLKEVADFIVKFCGGKFREIKI